jgi:hypothetical protein
MLVWRRLWKSWGNMLYQFFLSPLIPRPYVQWLQKRGCRCRIGLLVRTRRVSYQAETKDCLGGVATRRQQWRWRSLNCSHVTVPATLAFHPKVCYNLPWKFCSCLPDFVDSHRTFVQTLHVQRDDFCNGRVSHRVGTVPFLPWSKEVIDPTYRDKAPFLWKDWISTHRACYRRFTAAHASQVRPTIGSKVYKL